MNIPHLIEQGNIKLKTSDSSFIVLNTETKNLMRSPNLVHYRIRHLKPVKLLLLEPTKHIELNDLVYKDGTVYMVRTPKTASLANQSPIDIAITHSSGIFINDAQFKYFTPAQIDEIIVELNKRPELCTL